MDDGDIGPAAPPCRRSRQLQVAVQFVMRPRRGRGVCGGQGWREPVVDPRRHSFAGLFGAKSVARGMTCGAMAKPRARCAPRFQSSLLAGPLEDSGAEEQKFPPRLEGTNIERKRNRFGGASAVQARAS